ncbi:uncharacterized protein NECHADRAFT_80607 [Fusarium vanettenii 77-13-4]|uniref:Uncharacterized protein n=1 Tax=Fusarium vanettenii (strain ATCC MYA-4622 / CBS 123669 / FGSC 9596 / NRRL 45880 / 77-13-4) TaxID=660122 RepID=C7YS43_FUSV7|nr:uncharacterized protein NECHADRAFT_80607 [Fusarium vanettenii 77-13-4]EEU45180.1 hypothetical protein NECHADRAFT_80607 [Fusarium vanettenii 77-13-4]
MSTSLFSLGSRVFSVTGGASGMGAATVRLLAQHGAGAIWIADWNDGSFGQIKEDVERINPLTKVYTHKVDMSDPKQVDDWVASIIAESGVLHGAANVAGRSHGQCSRESHLTIVNVSSLASLLRGPSAFAYGASKAACAHFTSCVAKDVYSFGIRVNTVSSRQVNHQEIIIQLKAKANLQGNTYTAMTKEFFGHMSKEETEQQLQKLGVNTKMLEPEDVARVIVWLLSEASMDVNGVNLPVGEGAP